MNQAAVVHCPHAMHSGAAMRGAFVVGHISSNLLVYGGVRPCADWRAGPASRMVHNLRPNRVKQQCLAVCCYFLVVALCMLLLAEGPVLMYKASTSWTRGCAVVHCSVSCHVGQAPSWCARQPPTGCSMVLQQAPSMQRS